ncbi:hypothetical protein OIU74_019486 [Salix koriyanagi]|uniref:Uncharacterized protein n=1 Tax=Salix koriyanagi TaxID=2511006 RepID=A0A9Q0SL30_9ROSI|nr:hypothetical protein OIU74_019486 [Salix koriyanagi]
MQKKPNHGSVPGNSIRTFVFSWTIPLFLLLFSIKYRLPCQAFQLMQRLKNKLTKQSLKQIQENKRYDKFLFILKNKVIITLSVYVCTLLYLLPLWQTNKHLVSHSFMEKGSMIHGKNHQKPRKRLYLAFLIPFLLFPPFFSYFC